MSTHNRSRAELVQELAELRARLAERDRQIRTLSRRLAKQQSDTPPASDLQRRLIDAMMEGFLLAEVIPDRDGRPHDFKILEINEAAGRVLGIAPDDVAGVTSRQLVPDADPNWIELLGEVVLSGEPKQFEKFSRGLGKWFAVYAFSPAPNRLASLFMDITERKADQAALEHSRLLLAEAEMLSHTGAWEWDLAAGRFEFSDEWRAIHGCPKRFLTQDELIALAHPGDRSAVIQALEDVRRGKAFYDLEHRIVRMDDGSERVVHGYGKFVRDPAGAVVKVYGFARDITERKQAEKNLRRLSQFPEENPNPVLRFGLDGALEYANTPAQRWLAAQGWHADAPPPGAVAEAVVQAARSDRPVAFEVTGTDGRTCAFFAVRPHAADHVNLYGTEITERKRSEMATRRQNRLLAGINRIFGSVVASADDEDFGAACLTVAEEITGSTVSFLGEIGDDGMMRDIAISEATRKACTIFRGDDDRNRLSGSLHIHGVYGGVIAKGTSILTNDPAIHPDRVGLPEGHPPLTAFLGAPLKRGGRTIGMLAVGNRPGGYGPEDQDALEVLARVVGEALARRRVEQALREGEARYRNLFMYSPDAIYINQQDRVTLVNDACVRLFGAASPEALIGKSIYTLFHPDYHPVIQDRVQRMRTLGEAQPLIEEKILRFDGKSVDVEVIAAPFPLGGANAIHVILRDITERKRAEAALRESEARYRSLFQNKHAVMLLVDPREGRIVDANPAACEYYGYSREAITRLPISAINMLPPERLQSVLESALSARRQNFHFRHRLASGAIRDVEVFSGPIVIEGRQMLYSIVHDITERRQAEAALRESEERLKRAQEIAHLGGWEYDLSNRELIWSDEVYRIAGLPPDNFQPTYESFLATVHPSDRQRVDDAFRASLRNSQHAYEVEHRIIRPDGEIRHVHEKCEHQRDDTGRVIRSVGMVHDITERKKAEEALARSNKELEQFAYAASHDLQEPLRSIVGFLQLLQERYEAQIDDKGRHYIDRALAAGHRMQRLIRDLLALSRVTTSSGQLAPADLNHVLQKALSDLESTLQARKGRVTCGKLPTLSVDPSQIHSLFQNLVINGIKYNRSPEPRVEIGCRKRRNGYRFFVKDNGIGIAPQFHDRIFMVFQRLHTEREYPGTGLGLALCKRIVERHGGRIWVESQPEEGATFHFTLPGTR